LIIEAFYFGWKPDNRTIRNVKICYGWSIKKFELSIIQFPFKKLHILSSEKLFTRLQILLSKLEKVSLDLNLKIHLVIVIRRPFFCVNEIGKKNKSQTDN